MDATRIHIDVLATAPAEATLRMRGDIDIAADDALARAYERVATDGAIRVVLDFDDVGYINSTGIALIVRLLAEARRDHREVVATGLTSHYREIFRITRLSDYLTIADAGEPAGALEETTP